MKSIAIAILVMVAATSGWYFGKDYGRFDAEQKFAAQLTTKPLGSEAVGFKPLKDLPVLKQIELTVGGQPHKFVVGEIKEFVVKRYGVKSELVLDYNDVAVAEIIRATGMNKAISFVVKPDNTRVFDEYIHKPEPFSRQEPAPQQPVTKLVDDGVASEAAAAAIATSP